MVLYSSPECPYCHFCRIMLFCKEMDFEIRDYNDLGNYSLDVSTTGVHVSCPHKLVDSDLCLRDPMCMCLYMNERFPHPAMLPDDPKDRARVQEAVYGILSNFYIHSDVIENIRILESDTKADIQIKKGKIERAKQSLKRNLIVFSDETFIKGGKYLFKDQFTLLDVIIAPLLWRLTKYDINLPLKCGPLLTYGERIFSHESFMNALSPNEKVMRR